MQLFDLRPLLGALGPTKVGIFENFAFWIFGIKLTPHKIKFYELFVQIHFLIQGLPEALAHTPFPPKWAARAGLKGGKYKLANLALLHINDST